MSDSAASAPEQGPASATSAPATATAPSTTPFSFTSGTDAELSAWERRLPSLKASAAAGTTRSSDDNRRLTTTTTSASSATAVASAAAAAAAAAAPAVPGDVHHFPTPAYAPAAPAASDEKAALSPAVATEEEQCKLSRKVTSTLSHTALELDSQPLTAANGVQHIYLPAQDLGMTVTFVRRRTLNYVLYIVASILSVGIVALVAGFWVPNLYRSWCYAPAPAPTQEDLQKGNKVRCSVKIPAEPSAIYTVEQVTLPRTVAESEVFTPSMRLPFASPAEAADGSRQPLAGSKNAEISTLWLLSFRHTPLVYHAPSRKFVHLPEWRDAALVSRSPEPLEPAEISLRQRLFGPNIIDVQGQSTLSLICREVLHPFYAFSTAACGLWFYDDYQVYGAVVMGISILGITATVVQTKRSQARLRQMSRSEVDVDVLRHDNGAATREKPTAQWQTTSSATLVPGDIVSVAPLLNKSLPADMVLLDGSSCIVNESMLTGESTPSSKNPIEERNLCDVMAGKLDLADIEKHILWGGTMVMQAHADHADEHGAQNARVKALVLSTGWNSSKGSLVKMILFPKPINFKFYSDAFKFIAILSVIAILGFIGSAVNFVHIGVDGGEIGLRVIDLYTICIPPALPAAMSVCVTFALGRLKKCSIYCISPQRINVAGKVSVAVFDKTGTLTESGLDVRGVRLPGDNGQLGELAEHVETVREQEGATQAEKQGRMEEALAVTHDVTLIGGEALGDPLEVSMLGWTGWTLEAGSRTLQGIETAAEPGAAKPRPAKAQCVQSPSGSSSVAILRKFDFSPSLRRMSVLSQRASAETCTAFVKGAPEAVTPLCDPSTLPSDLEQVLNEATRKGLRVLAFGYKSASLSYAGCQRASRDFVESNLTFLGLLFFENRLKDTSAPVIAELHEALIPTKMCTGDAVNTAIAVARQAGMIPAGQPVFVPRAIRSGKTGVSTEGMSSLAGNKPSELVWSDIDLPEAGENGAGEGLDPYSLSPRDPSLSLSTVGLALTGDVFTHLLSHASEETLARLLVRAQVFARFSPELKAELVERLQVIGHTVAFCGDGANDTGALKGADVGLSLSEAEASVAAPFTSGDEALGVGALTALIKEGRNCLDISSSLFLFMAIYAISEYYSVILLYGQASSFDNASYLFIDIFWVFSTAFGSANCKPAATLSRNRRPSSRLMTRRVLLSFAGAVVLLIAAQTTPYALLHSQSWYEAPEVDPSDLQLDSQDSTVVAKTSFFTYAIAALVWNVGPPHRQPLWRNWLLSAAILILTTLNLAILFSNAQSNGLIALFGFYTLPTHFLFVIFGTVLVQAACAFAWEWLLIDYVCAWLEAPLRKHRAWRCGRKVRKARARAEKRRRARISGSEETAEAAAEAEAEAELHLEAPSASVDVEKKYRAVERALKHEEEQRRKVEERRAGPPAVALAPGSSDADEKTRT